jgi:hypothetical protein
MLTIFANLRINEKERLQHMKDSFNSFKTISDDWVINIRGKQREEAIKFLKENLGSKMTLFELLDDSRGWLVNALEMVDKAKYDYLLVWNEDHMNIAPQEIYKGIMTEMKENDVDYMMYSWWIFGTCREVFDKLKTEIGLQKFQYIDTVYLTKERWKKVLKAGYPYFIISLCGIFYKDLFKKMLKDEQKKLPIFLTRLLFKAMGFLTYYLHILGRKHKRYFWIVNKVFFHKLRKFSRETPFELEQPETRTDRLPLKMAFPKQELFACIDDDLSAPETQGSSLISRGLYPLQK